MSTNGSDTEQADAQKRSADGTVVELPKKRFYRQRAHANPLNDHTFE